jgi:hypothetical protein
MIEGSGSGFGSATLIFRVRYLPKAVAREVHMMTSGDRRIAAGIARPRAAAKLPQNVAVISAPSCFERPRQGNKRLLPGSFFSVAGLESEP